VTNGPSTGAHLLAAETLPQLGLAVDCGAVFVGVNEAGAPAAVQLFRSQPTQVMLVTAAYVARLFALRALATGAAVAMATSRPEGWQPVAACVPPGCAAFVAPGAPQPAESTPDLPLLRCDDLGPGGAGAHGDLGAWQSRLIVQDFTPASAVPGLRAYDLVVLQRVRPDLAHPLQAAFGLSAQLADALPRMPDDVIALLTPRRAEFVRLVPSLVETSLLGAPVRHDG
jgi:hypothetical protein